MVIQAEEKTFLAQVAVSSGKGPDSFTHYRTDKKTQTHAAKVCGGEFVDKSARQEAREEKNNPQVYALGSGMRHKPLKEEITEHSFLSKNKGKMGDKTYRIFMLV